MSSTKFDKRCKGIIKILTAVRKRYLLVPSKDIDDQRTLESNWTRGKSGHTQSKLIVSDTTFLDD